MGGQEASENKTRAVNERRLRREVEGTDSQVFHHQGATAPGGFGPGGFGPGGPAARVLQDDGGCVGRLKGEGAGVGGVVGDERGDALEDDPLVRWRQVDEVCAGEEPAFSGGDSGVSPRMSRVCVGTPRWRSSIAVRASFITTATWRGERPQPSRWVSTSGMRVPRMLMSGRSRPGGVVEEGEFVVVLRQGDGRVNVRLGLADEEDLAGKSGGWSSRGSARRRLSRRCGGGT